MRFLVDAQLPPALAYWLREMGHDARSVREEGLRDASDSVLWEHAITHDRVIITKDEDFADRSVASRAGPRILWLRIGNCTNDALFTWLLPLLPTILDQLSADHRLVEVVRRS